MSGLVSAIQRQQGRAQALQAHAVRVAAWGGAEDFGRLMDRLTDNTRREVVDNGERDAALAAFGLRAE